MEKRVKARDEIEQFIIDQFGEDHVTHRRIVNKDWNDQFSKECDRRFGRFGKGGKEIKKSFSDMTEEEFNNA